MFKTLLVLNVKHYRNTEQRFKICSVKCISYLKSTKPWQGRTILSKQQCHLHEILVFSYKNFAPLATDQRANVTIYFCNECAASYKPRVDDRIDFKAPRWQQITTLNNEKKTQKYFLSTPRTARFVALARKGFVNLVEVEIYRYPCEYIRWICASLNN